jgi:hypothetical protein
MRLRSNKLEEIPPLAQEILSRVDTLCAKLGTTSEAVWEMCLKQVKVGIIHDAIWVIVPVLLLMFGILVVRGIERTILLGLREVEAGDKFEVGRRRQENEIAKNAIRNGCRLANIIIAAVTGFMFVVTLSAFIVSLTHLLNVQYYALENLKELLQNII